jgi:hypothetical protein
MVFLSLIISPVQPRFTPEFVVNEDHNTCSCSRGGRNIVSDCVNQIGEALLFDAFESMPLGFNNSIWTLEMKNNPTLTWVDNKEIVLNGQMWKRTTLKSVLETGPNVIADFEISYTEGDCYFGIGWADEYRDPNDEWASNLRASQNGVFIDYWDNQLFLVSGRDGKHISTPISNVSLKEEHKFRLIWSESLVILQIDGKESAYLSIHIPSVTLSFIITICGQHYRVKNDQLRVESVLIGSRNWYLTNIGPGISLLWPQNDSCIYDFDVIDLEIEGNISNVYCSWDSLSNFTILAPWDVSVSNLNGSHTLHVFAVDISGDWSLAIYRFQVISQETSIEVPEILKQPIIDGAIGSQEEEYYTKKSVMLRCEDRSERQLDIYLGFFQNSLYLAVLTSLQDRYYSRISLYIDGEGDGIYGNTPLESSHDLCIIIPTPSAYPVFRQIRTPSGQEINPVGIVYDCAISEQGVVAEFLVALNSVNGNSSVGIGIGLVVSQGGFDSFFPMGLSNQEFNRLIVVENAGLNQVVLPDGYSSVLFVALSCTFLVLGIAYLKRRDRLILIEETLSNENLERVRTLMDSYPEITIERLALLANMDIKTTRESVDRLISKGLFDSSILISKTRIRRNAEVTEKIQK